MYILTGQRKTKHGAGGGRSMGGLMRKRMTGMVLALVAFLTMVKGTGWVKVKAMDTGTVHTLDSDAFRMAENMLVAAGSVVDVIEDHLVSGPGGAVFRGSRTPAFIRRILLVTIGEQIPDEVVTATGVGEGEMAQEIYVMACIYYDAIHFRGEDQKMAHRMAAEEGVRYLLVEKMGVTEDDARSIISSLRDHTVGKSKEPTVWDDTVGSLVVSMRADGVTREDARRSRSSSRRR